MLVYMLVLVYCQVLVSAALNNTITKRDATTANQKCPACQKSELCTEKYEAFSGHTACMPKSKAASTFIAMTDAVRTEIVNHHNKLRASVYPTAANMLKLRWDNELEMLAQRWAEACKKDASNNFLHDQVRLIPGRFFVGQNLAWGAVDSFQQATDMWFAEKEDYAQYFGEKLLGFPTKPMIGHYTQMVWADNALIGCASAKCDVNFFVCNYAPGGNIFPFSSPYKSGTTKGEMCKLRTEEGLCDCGDLACENNAPTNVSTCSCKCMMTQAAPYCSLDCSKADVDRCGAHVNFLQSECDKAYVVSACPHLCGICPCAEKKYKSVMCRGESNCLSKIMLLVSVLCGYVIRTCYHGFI